jgi:copper homeostasis protein
MLFELAVFNAASVEVAQACSVDRIELCTDYAAGGLSPDMDLFSYARKTFNGPVFVMIRPRPGDFIYHQDELVWMKKAIRKYDVAGADGFVLGYLKDNCVDAVSLNLLVEAAGKKPVTFHRAIDSVDDYEAGIQTLIACGCSRVLSSGTAASAAEGIDNISRMAEKYGRQISFLAGGGIRSGNIQSLLNWDGLSEFHSAAVTGIGETANLEEVQRLMAAIKSRI